MISFNMAPNSQGTTETVRYPRTKTVAPEGVTHSLGGPVRALYGMAEFILAGGSFPGLAAVHQESTGWLPLLPGSGTGEVRAFEVDLGSNSVYVGGDFTELGGSPRMNLARVFYRGEGVIELGEDLGKNLEINGSVEALCVGDGRLYMGGSFTSLDGETRVGLGALNPDTGELLNWKAQVILSLGTVRALTYDSGCLYVGYDGGVFGLDSDTGEILPWWNVMVDCDGPILTMVRFGTVLYVGGNFTGFWQFDAAGNQFFTPRPGLAALDAFSGILLDWVPDVSIPVSQMVLDGSSLYFGGDQGLGAVHILSGEAIWAPAIQPGDVTCVSRGSLVAGLSDGVILYPGKLHRINYLAPIPGAPVAPSAKPARAGTITLRLPKLGTNADSLALERSVDDTNYERVADSLGDRAEYTDVGLQRNSNYFYRVVSVNDSGETPGPSLGVYIPTR